MVQRGGRKTLDYSVRARKLNAVLCRDPLNSITVMFTCIKAARAQRIGTSMGEKITARENCASQPNGSVCLFCQDYGVAE